MTSWTDGDVLAPRSEHHCKRDHCGVLQVLSDDYAKRLLGGLQAAGKVGNSTGNSQSYCINKE